MKNKIILIVSALLFVALIAGAGTLYNKLGETNDSGGLVVDMSKEQSTEAPSGSAPSSDTESPIETETQEPTDSTDTSTNTENDTEPATTKAPEEPTNPAPDFTMVDVNGKEIKLSELRGKPVVLNFWASWCGYCVEEMPDFEEFYKKYGNDIHFVMLNTVSGGETLSSAKSFIAKAKYTFPVYFDQSGLASQFYGANAGIPKTFFIDSIGNLVAHCPGMLDSSILAEGIEMIS